ncbi:MAG: AHH domain-containing protein [Flavisolibacter sp.]
MVQKTENKLTNEPKYHEHHLIPNKIYTEFKNELQELDWVQDEEENLMKLPVPFHGNHPSYSGFVKKEVQKILESSTNKLKDLKQLQKDLRDLIQNVHDSGRYERMNHYFKSLGYK